MEVASPIQTDLLGDTSYKDFRIQLLNQYKIIGGDFFGGGSLLFNLEGFSSPDDSDELELELELEESDFGVSSICDGWS